MIAYTILSKGSLKSVENLNVYVIWAIEYKLLILIEKRRNVSCSYMNV
jgi:hypothetical protein